MNTFRVLVTGSRRWPSQDAVWEALAFVCCENLPDGGTLTVVHGACKTGADAFARSWCAIVDPPTDVTDIHVLEEPHPVKNWQHCRPECNHPPKRHRDGTPYCPAAGNYRNADMVALGADLVLAFPLPGPRSRSTGTWDCVKRAEAAGLPVEVQSLDFQPRLEFDAVADAVAAADSTEKRAALPLPAEL